MAAARSTEPRLLAAWSTQPRPWLGPRDVFLIAYIPALTALAWGFPERAWPAIARVWARAALRLRPARTAKQRARLLEILGERALGADSQRLLTDLVALRHVERMQVLRWYRPGGWHPRIEVIGAEHVQAALAAGRGALLWQQPFAHSGLAGKMALAQAGIRAVHLSRFDHGISTSRLGSRLLNPPWKRAESHYLAARLEMSPGHSAAALREVARLLRANRVVSITVGVQSQHTRRLPFLSSEIELAEGPAALAWRARAAFLPVFTVATAPGGFRCTIEPPIEAPAGLEREAAVGRMLGEFVRRLEPWALRFPEQYVGWDV
jgi:lauroyl/myristoyl acyltransferase